MQTNWHEHFFQGLALEVWRKAVPPEQTRGEADFVVETLNLSKGARILDVPCGNGRHSIELAKRGYRVTGIDLCSEFLAEARLSAEYEGLNIHWIEADMRNIPAHPLFDAAFCFGNSFGYMPYEQSIDLLNAVNACLKPGSLFILETGLAAESLLPALPNKRWYKVGDIFQLSELEYDASQSQLTTHYTFIRGATVETGTARYSVYTVAEFRRLFTMCGFTITDLFCSTKREPYRLGKAPLIIVASKRELQRRKVSRGRSMLR